MIRFIYNNFFILFIFLEICFPQTKSEFAEHLFNTGDYYRAISIYKELIFFSKDRDSIYTYQMQIGRALRLSKKYESSTFYFTNLINDSNFRTSNRNKLDNCYFNLSLNYIALKSNLYAIQFANMISDGGKDKKDFLYAYYYLRNYKFDSALFFFDLSELKTNDNNIKYFSKTYKKNVTEYLKQPQKSPTLSTIFSIFIPGLGQAYCKHYVDAIQAFGFVSIFLLTTYSSYRYENKYSSSYPLTAISAILTGSFYIANIISANKTAQFYNQRLFEKYFDDIEYRLINTNF